jgi:outer membrane autotransporter protein
VEGGGRVLTRSSQAGATAGTLTTARIQGENSQWLANQLILGQNGSADVRVEAGGSLSTDGTLVLAQEKGSSSLVTVTGDKSNIDTLGLDIGVGGTASLTVEAGADVRSRGGSVGLGTGSVATAKVTGTGSTWTNSIGLAVGDSGTGTLTVEAGGKVTTFDASLGTAATGTGRVQVTGGGAGFDVTHDLTIGDVGGGTLAVGNGGSVTSGGATVAAGVGGTGEAGITGAGSTWQNDGDLVVGGSGQGSLGVTAGGRVATGAFIVGRDEAGTGTATINGGGSFLVTQNDLVVANRGRGTLDVTAGAAASSGSAVIGAVTGSVGAVSVGGDGSRLAVANGITVGDAGSGSLTVQSGGTVDAGAIIIARLNGSSGTLNIGSASSSSTEAIASGVLNAGQIQFGQGAGRLHLNHSEDDLVLGSAISGAGAIEQVTGTTTLTGNSAAFTGTTDVQGGVFRVEGALGGSLTVRDAARLTGGGTIGSTTVERGGILAPGTGVGTLDVSGDLSLQAGSVTELEINRSGQADALAVSGTASLGGGTLSIVGTPPRYVPLTRILTAQEGVTGTFAPVENPLTFLDVMLLYGPNSVDLSLTRNNVLFADVAETPNQRATAGGIDSMPRNDAVTDALVMLDDNQARAAFDQLSGEVHASAVTAALSDALVQRGAILARLRSLQDRRSNAVQPEARAYAPEARIDVPSPYLPADTAQEPLVTAFGAWAQGFGAWGHTESDGNAAALDRRQEGFITGVDGGGEVWRLGAVGGYSRNEIDVSASASSATVEGAFGALYGGASIGDLNVRAGASYAFNTVETDRTVAFGTLNDRLSASYDGSTAQAFGEIGYNVALGPAELEPFAGGAVVRVHTDPFSEDAGPAALTGESRDNDLGVTTLGVRGTWQVGLLPFSLRGMAAWQHAFGDLAHTQALAFRAGSSGFEIGGVPVDRDALLAEAGVHFDISENAGLDVAYTGSIGSGTQVQGVTGRFATRF